MNTSFIDVAVYLDNIKQEEYSKMTNMDIPEEKQYLITYKNNNPFSNSGNFFHTGTKDEVECFISKHPNYAFGSIYEFKSRVEVKSIIEWE